MIYTERHVATQEAVIFVDKQHKKYLLDFVFQYWNTGPGDKFITLNYIIN